MRFVTNAARGVNSERGNVDVCYAKYGTNAVLVCACCRSRVHNLGGFIVAEPAFIQRGSTRVIREVSTVRAEEAYVRSALALNPQAVRGGVS